MDCKIRRWRLEDAKKLAFALNNKKVLDNLRDGLPYPYTSKHAEGFIQAMLTSDPNAVFSFAITIKDQVIGSIGVFRQDNIHSRTAEMGYYVAESYWGQGVTTSAIQQICRFIFETTDIIRIYAEPFATNYGSCKVLEKNGFLCEGTLRCNAVKNGVIRDMKLYSLIKEVEE